MTEIGRNSQKHHCLLICLGGGHLAAHYCNAYNWPEVRGSFSESKPVNALMLFYPVITTSPEFAPPGSFPKLLGKGKLTQEEKERFSCENMVSEKTPPTFLWHTRTDNCVSVMNSLLYAQALTKHDVPFALHIYPQGGHGLSTVDQWCNGDLSAAVLHAGDWFDAAIKWLSFTL